MRFAALAAFVAGVCVLQRQAELPSLGATGVVAAVAALAMVVARLTRRADGVHARALLLAAAAAAANASACACQRSATALGGSPPSTTSHRSRPPARMSIGSFSVSYSYGGCFQAKPSGHRPAMAAMAAV